jgi:AraC-like DNA-binding protein
MPIKEIAFRLNFRSDSHFVIWFRRLTASRPGEYRRRYLGQLPPPAKSRTSVLDPLKAAAKAAPGP